MKNNTLKVFNDTKAPTSRTLDTPVRNHSPCPGKWKCNNFTFSAVQAITPQMLLAALGLIEVIRRFSSYEVMPVFHTMIVISFLALIANSISLWLIQRTKSNEAHMQASVIFTSNDIIINAGVIVAGVLVYFTESKYPDLIVGMLIFGIVIRGAYRILKLSR